MSKILWRPLLRLIVSDQLAQRYPLVFKSSLTMGRSAPWCIASQFPSWEERLCLPMCLLKGKTLILRWASSLNSEQKAFSRTPYSARRTRRLIYQSEFWSPRNPEAKRVLMEPCCTWMSIVTPVLSDHSLLYRLVKWGIGYTSTLTNGIVQLWELSILCILTARS